MDPDENPKKEQTNHLRSRSKGRTITFFVAEAELEMGMLGEKEAGIVGIERQLERIEALLLEALTIMGREWFDVEQVAELTGYRPYTIRQACNNERIDAEKRSDGRWRIHRKVVIDIKDNGLPTCRL